MKVRIGMIFAWICAILVSVFTVMSGIMGILLREDPAAIEVGQRLGILGMEYQLALAKIIIITLYLIPRTSTVGFVLLVGYFGGMLATNITHDFTFVEMAPIYVCFVLLTISAYFRNPELLSRLLKKPVSEKV